MTTLAVQVPARVDSSLSLNGRLHWRALKRKTDALRLAVRCRFGFEQLEALARLSGRTAVVTLTRCGPRLMDTDNSVSALKSVRDEVAALLRIDDGDERLRWVYQQRKGPWGVEIQIEEVLEMVQPLPWCRSCGGVP